MDQVITDPSTVVDVARIATGRPNAVIEVTDVTADAVPVTNFTTAGLARIRGTATDATTVAQWSVVVKVVQTPTRSPMWRFIPAEVQAAAAARLPWRSEADIYTSDLRTRLPPGLRLPTIYRVHDVDDGAMAIWMEDVDHHPGAWTSADYRHVARLLGRMAGGTCRPDPPLGVPVTSRDLRGYLHGRVRMGALPLLHDDATWTHPLVTAFVDPALRSALDRLDAIGDELLDRLDTLPRTLAHGDACPQNLLRATASDDVVAIDWQFGGLYTIGFDAGQLFAGHAESGDLHATRFATTLAAVVDAYTAGIRDQGVPVPDDAIRLGAVGALLIRSAFTALPLERLTDSENPIAPPLFEHRARYAQFLVDLVETV